MLSYFYSNKNQMNPKKIYFIELIMMYWNYTFSIMLCICNLFLLYWQYHISNTVEHQLYTIVKIKNSNCTLAFLMISCNIMFYFHISIFVFEVGRLEITMKLIIKIVITLTSQNPFYKKMLITDHNLWWNIALEANFWCYRCTHVIKVFIIINW